MSNHTKTLNETAIISLLKELDSLAKTVKSVRDKLLKVFPSKYGSDLWWEKSDKEAIEGIKAGRGKKFNTYEQAVKYLNG